MNLRPRVACSTGPMLYVTTETFLKDVYSFVCVRKRACYPVRKQGRSREPDTGLEVTRSIIIWTKVEQVAYWATQVHPYAIFYLLCICCVHPVVKMQNSYHRDLWSTNFTVTPLIPIMPLIPNVWQTLICFSFFKYVFHF